MRYRKIALLSLLTILLIAFTVFLSSNLGKTKIVIKKKAATQTVNFRIEIGKEEIVVGPMNDNKAIGNNEFGTGGERYLYDTPFITVPYSGGIRLYMANNRTFRYSVTNSADLGNFSRWGSSMYPVLRPGSGPLDYQGVIPNAGNQWFDNCGAFLNSVYKLSDTHWIGWYHAEHRLTPDCSGESCTRTMAFTESFDAGLTWTKGDAVHPYPNNEVISTPKDVVVNGYRCSSQGINGVGDHADGQVIRVGDYFYMYFIPTKTWKISVARSSVADQGRPGTWFKYYCNPATNICDWTEPGIGGMATGLTGISNVFRSHSSYVNRYISINTSGRSGFMLELSPSGSPDDLLNFEVRRIFPEVSTFNDLTVDDWPSTDRSNMKSVYGYPSLMSLTGDRYDLGQEFYLYYMKIYPSEGFDRRTMIRRRIKFVLEDDPIIAKTPLVEYQVTWNNKRKTMTSVEAPNPKEGYVENRTIGYISSVEYPGFLALYDCKIEDWNDHVLTATSLPSPIGPSGWTQCPGTTGNVSSFVRKLGYIAQYSGTAGADLPLYMCFDSINENHFVDTDVNCGGKENQFKMGYIFRNTIPPCAQNLTASCNSGTQATFSWSSVSGATNYHLGTCDHTPPGVCPPYGSYDTTGTSITINVTCGHRYGWWVVVTPGGCQTTAGLYISCPCPTNTPTPIPCPLKTQGDANCDGVINILDFETWRREFLNQTGLNSDFDGNGTVNILDFEIWRRGFLGQ